MIFTSGSTGTPKGVAVPHCAITRLVLNTNYVELGPEDRIAHLSNVCFDAATFEIWGALLNGACDCIVPRAWPSILRFLPPSSNGRAHGLFCDHRPL